MKTYIHDCRPRLPVAPSLLKIKLKASFVLATYLLLMNANNALAQNSQTSPILSLNDAISLAQANDDYLLRSRLLQASLVDKSEGATALPDTNISMGLLNLPTDGFAFDQEPMTQLKIGASQMFGRGDTLALREERFNVAADEQPYLRADRLRKIALYTTQLWLDAYKGTASYRLVDEAKPLFEKLSDIVGANYASSVGNARQQDIIRAELELLRLNDRLVAIDSQRRISIAKLSQYLYTKDHNSLNFLGGTSPENVKLPSGLDPIDTNHIKALQKIANADEHTLFLLTAHHPVLGAFEQQVKASSLDIDIAKQSVAPQFGVNASYALRDDQPSGNQANSRADFFSVGVSMSLPLFSSKQRDANIAGSVKIFEAMRTQKRLLMRELIAGLRSAYEDFLGSAKRYQIYQQQIIPQMSQQADASLNAYTNDTGDFAEVVRAKIAELDAKVTQLEIDVSKRKALAQMHYFIAASSDMRGDK